MTDSLPERLNSAEVRSVSLSAAEVEAKQKWLLAEAEARLRTKAENEASGLRWASRDLDAKVTIEQGDPATKLGQAWIEYNKARTDAALAKVDAKRLERIHWEEVRRQ